MSRGDLLGKMVEVKYMDGSVRNEGKVVSYSEAPSVQVEYPDGTRESWLAHLVDPKPAVTLPSVPTLGWLEAHGERNLAIWELGKEGLQGKATLVYRVREDITAFVEAVAVPKSALDELRVSHASRTIAGHDCSSGPTGPAGTYAGPATCAFLTAIDNAGAEDVSA